MHKNKKSEGLPINMIVIAAIALGVLVVTFVILTRQSSTASNNLDSCALKGGKCAKDLGIKDGSSCNDPNGVYVASVIVSDPLCGKSKLCCLKIG